MSKHLEEIKKILDYIHENPESTQRELVNKLDISLGKVNFIVNALVDRGLIKIERFKNSKNKKGYLYFLTPKGIVEKVEITRSFLKSKMEEYERLKAQIEALKVQTGPGE